MSAVNKRICKTTHKYGIELTTDSSDGHRTGTKNGSIFWKDSIDLEMRNNGVAFEILEEDKPAPPGWHKVTCHLVFETKMDFT